MGDYSVKVPKFDELLRSAEIIQVIRVEVSKGEGIDDNPCRMVLRFFLTDGTYIGEIDHFKQGEAISESLQELYPQLFQK